MEPTPVDAAATLSAQTGSESRQGDVPITKDAVNKISNRNYWSWIPLTEMLFVRYSKREQDALCYFQKLATDSRKLPREWKRYLNYHRLVWYIFYLTREGEDLAGWQVQLITWIFVCWEWQENMNFIIQNWNEVGVMKTIESNGPSLQMIVDHFIELEIKKHMKRTEASPEIAETKEPIPEARDTNNRNNETEITKKEQEKSEKASKENVPGVDAGPSEKTLREELDELKKEIKDLKDYFMNGPLQKTLRKELDELKKDIKDLKKQHSMKNEKREEEKKMKLKRWKRLRSALDKYDVTMDGILAFQRFRFYCIAGHLSWPLPEQENNEH